MVLYVPVALAIINSASCICVLYECHEENMIISSNSINQLIFVMVKCGVLCEVRV
jgi:hypothetical protein